MMMILGLVTSGSVPAKQAVLRCRVNLRWVQVDVCIHKRASQQIGRVGAHGARQRSSDALGLISSQA